MTSCTRQKLLQVPSQGACRQSRANQLSRNASATSRPHIPECPVGNISEFEILRTLPDGQSGLPFDFLALGTFHNHV